jgi:hypothetical protein
LTQLWIHIHNCFKTYQCLAINHQHLVENITTSELKETYKDCDNNGSSPNCVTHPSQQLANM